MTHGIYRTMFRRLHEPRAGLVGNALVRPLLERCHERVVGKLLGLADVAHDSGEARDELRPLDAKHRLDRGMRRRNRHLPNVLQPATGRMSSSTSPSTCV